MGQRALKPRVSPSQCSPVLRSQWSIFLYRLSHVDCILQLSFNFLASSIQNAIVQLVISAELSTASGICSQGWMPRVSTNQQNHPHPSTVFPSVFIGRMEGRCVQNQSSVHSGPCLLVDFFGSLSSIYTEPRSGPVMD